MKFCLAENETPTFFSMAFFKKMPTCNRFLPMNVLYFCAGAVRVSAPRNLLAGCPGDQQAMPQLPARRVACCFTARHRSLIDTYLRWNLHSALFVRSYISQWGLQLVQLMLLMQYTSSYWGTFYLSISFSLLYLIKNDTMAKHRVRLVLFKITYGCKCF